jgi:dTDP-4-dehydrorhamnose 3,5-epimerase
MIITETKLKGAFIIELEKVADVRGFFARSWSRREFTAQGLNGNLSECNVSFNKTKGTLRGMHYQAEPYEQVKLVRCTSGAIHDVIIDLRPESNTFKQWVGIELTAHNHLMIYIPKGFAHGFQTLTDNSEVFYQMSADYVPESGRGVRWDDPAFGIEWPEAERIIIARDKSFPDFDL